MNLRRLLAATAFLAANAASAATTLPPEVTRDLARRLDDLGGATFARHDYDKFVKETFPGIIEMTGGRAKMIETMKVAFAQMDAQHVKFISHTSRPESRTTDAGKYEVLMLVEESVLEAGGKRVHVDSYSLAVRTKPNGPWTFIGGSGIAKTPQMLWALLPDLPKDYKLPPYDIKPM